MDLIAHLTRQAAFSRATFGPSARTRGVCEHIRKELIEVEDCYPDPDEDDALPVIPGMHMEAAREWTDVAILGLDGLLRAISAAHPKWTFDMVAHEAVIQIKTKQAKNELRDWPDWRKADPDTAIEHVRGKHD